VALLDLRHSCVSFLYADIGHWGDHRQAVALLDRLTAADRTRPADDAAER
jgi:hypothetical protein